MNELRRAAHQQASGHLMEAVIGYHGLNQGDPQVDQGVQEARGLSRSLRHARSRAAVEDLLMGPQLGPQSEIRALFAGALALLSEGEDARQELAMYVVGRNSMNASGRALAERRGPGVHFRIYREEYAGRRVAHRL